MNYLWIFLVNIYLFDLIQMLIETRTDTLKKTQLVTRLPRLLRKINKQIDRIENEENNELLEIYHLYYDGE
jgi:hypothetical protein